MVMPENPQFRKVDATTSFQHDLDTRLTQLYPLVESFNSPVLNAYRSGELHFVSFDIRNPKLAREVLHQAINRAADAENGVTYSDHGAQHEVFQESLSRLKSSITKGRISMGFQSLSIDIKQGPKLESFPIERLIVQGEKFDRDVLRPIPHDFAKNLPREEKAYIKRIREASKENGIPFGILACLYKGLETQQIFDILGNREFRNSLPPGTKTFHLSHTDDKNMITPLSKSIVEITSTGRYPKMSSDSYYSGLAILRQFGWNIPKNATGTNYGFVEVAEKPYPRAVFAGVVQIAQEQASTDFKDPARTEYIYRKYENIATTKLITSFLVFDK